VHLDIDVRAVLDATKDLSDDQVPEENRRVRLFPAVAAAPGARAVSWGVLVAALLLAVSSMLVDVPRWLAGLSPYAHQPDVLGAETAGGTWTGPAVCLALAAILTFVGARGLSRRDLMA